MHSRTGFKRSGDITKPVVAGNGERAYLVWVDDNVVSDAGLYDGRLRSDLGGGHWNLAVTGNVQLGETADLWQCFV